MRSLFAAVGVALLAALSGVAADTKGTTVTWADLKSTTPADWKEETPSSKLRQGQFKLPKAEGDKEDAEVAIFFSPGGGGIEANLKRQLAAFEPAKGKEKVTEKSEKIKVGGYDAVCQEVSGTLLKKTAPFDPNAKVTPLAGYKQIYVIFETKDGAVASMWLRGPEKTVDMHKKGFDEWVKGFK